ncbi:hypothetical protein CK203_040032 [Vitis vinifera]|uniref:Retrotransposon gag domain-containing protein n=1 Tax=Vitis vinifera TaxID=29760 RepID=A0A438IE83_VITVI|nr:hypothetical protein CK203_040032 [Vitis vinifera]
MKLNNWYQSVRFDVRDFFTKFDIVKFDGFGNFDLWQRTIKDLLVQQGCPDTPSEGIRTIHPDSGSAPPFHPAAATLYPTAATLHPDAALSTRMYHIRKSAAAAITSRCLTSGTLYPDILHPAPDAGWERRAFCTVSRIRIRSREPVPKEVYPGSLFSEMHPLYSFGKEVINFVDYSLNQGAPAGHESADTPSGHESNGAVAGDGATLQMTSQPKTKGEMYILNDGMNMKAKIAAMERRLEELEMNQMQEVQAISQTPLQAMPCAICLSYEHLVKECPTIPVAREMFGDCNTYNSNWRKHPNFSWKPQPPQYQQPTQAPQQASNLEQAMMNLNKVMGDFVEAKKSIVDQVRQEIDSQDKKTDGRLNDLSQKTDNLEYTSSRNVKRVERRKLRIKKSSKSKERAWPAKFRSKTAKRSLGTRVPFRKPVHPFRSCEMAAKPPRLEILHFAADEPFRRVFRNCETTLWHTSATSQHPYAHFATAKWAVKIALLREIHPPLRKCSKLQKWAAKFPFCCQMISKLPNGCEMISKLQNGCKMASKLQKGYEKAPGIKMGCEMISQPHSYPL